MNKTQNANMLRPSDPDFVILAETIEEKFLSICHLYERLNDAELPIPESVGPAMLLWRTVRLRHLKQDFRNTTDEVKAVEEMAQWTLDVNCELRNQPKQVLDFQWK